VASTLLLALTVLVFLAVQIARESNRMGRSYD